MPLELQDVRTWCQSLSPAGTFAVDGNWLKMPGWLEVIVEEPALSWVCWLLWAYAHLSSTVHIGTAFHCVPEQAVGHLYMHMAFASA